MFALAALLSLALQDPPAPAEAPVRVALQLLADRTRVEPGASFELAAYYAIPPGWHIYWENPGDSGIKTEAKLTAPEGFAVEGPLYPGPDPFVESGKTVAYGYQREALLIFRVRAPAELAAGSKLRFALRSRWSMCREVCYFGESDEVLELAVADAAHPAEPANTKLFARGRARLPRPWSELTGAEARWEMDRESGATAAVVRVPGADRLGFLPKLDGSLEVTSSRLVFEPRATTLALEVKPRKDARALTRELHGVVRVERGTHVAWYALDMTR